MDKRKTRTVLKEVLNVESSSGEILSANRTMQTYTVEPDYVKLYIERLPVLLGLEGAVGKILLGLCRKLNYDNEIILKLPIKNEICKGLGIKVNTLEHGISSLVRIGVLLRKGNGWYLMNPHFIAKGSWQNIKEIRQSIVYSERGMTVSAEFLREDGKQLNMDLEP